LFYVSADGRMMAVAVTTGATFEAGSPVALFQTHRRQPVSSQDVFSYDVSGDGQRFLILSKVDEANPAPLCRSSNWAIELVPAAVPLRRSCSAAVTLSFSC